MKMKTWAIIAATTLALLTTQTSVYGWYPYGKRYQKWQEKNGFMMAGVHNTLPADHLPERLAHFKAAGLNTLFTMEPHNSLKWHQAAHAAGLQWATEHPERFVSPNWKVTNPASPLNGLQVNEMFARVLDMPGATFIKAGDGPKTEEHLDNIAQFTKWVRTKFPDVLMLTCLSIEQLAASITDYDEDRYIAQTRPDVFAYFKYPLRIHDESPQFLAQMRRGRDAAHRHRLPNWMYVQTWEQPPIRRDGTQRDADGWLRLPDEADVRYLLFTFLAHGGNGVMFYLYYGHDGTVMMEDTVADEARDPADRHRLENLVPTRAWHAVRDVAPEVQTLSRALLNLRTKNPIGYVGETIPDECSAFKGHDLLDSVVNLDNPGERLLITFFDDKAGEDYFMVVNLVHGLNMSKMDGSRMVRLTFDTDVEKIERLNRLTGQIETLQTKVEGESRVLDVLLPGGTGDLFKWSNGNPWSLRPM
tara:strand:- start:3828 stop:5246 length:1419 start_codon:yes stop_codon:yes gene_type:complete